MLKNSSILVAFAMFVASTAKVTPVTKLEPHDGVVVTYHGNNMFFGARTDNDYLHFNGTSFKHGMRGKIITDTLTLVPWQKINYVEIYDRASVPIFGAFPKLVSGGLGKRNDTAILFTSKVGRDIKYEFFVWAEREKPESEK